MGGVSSHRLLIVSNRLPVTAHLVNGEVRLSAASGGLATGLRPWHEGSGGLWIGWPGDTSRFSPDQKADLERQLSDRAIVQVSLSADHVKRYYHGFANRVLWPLFHYLIDRVPVDAEGWDAYRAGERDVCRRRRPGVPARATSSGCTTTS
jgi:trehalose 6-phosphate synthase/phosphatase